MTKNEIERYSKRFVALGVLLIGIGALNWLRGDPENGWTVISSVGCLALGITQFLLAHRLHKKAQRM